MAVEQDFTRGPLYSDARVLAIIVCLSVGLFAISCTLTTVYAVILYTSHPIVEINNVRPLHCNVHGISLHVHQPIHLRH